MPKSRNELPYHVLRLIRRYRAEFRDEITRYVKAKQATSGEVKAEDIGAAAFDVISGLGRPEKDEKTLEDLSLKAYHAGNFKYLDELIAEWQNELQGCAT